MFLLVLKREEGKGGEKEKHRFERETSTVSRCIPTGDCVLTGNQTHDLFVHMREMTLQSIEPHQPEPEWITAEAWFGSGSLRSNLQCLCNGVEAGFQGLDILGLKLGSTIYKPCDYEVIFLTSLFLSVLRDRLENIMPTFLETLHDWKIGWQTCSIHSIPSDLIFTVPYVQRNIYYFHL